MAATMFFLAPSSASARPVPAQEASDGPRRAVLGNVPGAAFAPERTVPPRSEIEDLPASIRLEQQFAEYVLRAKGIGWRSTGQCSDPAVPTCTSFEGLRWGSLRGLLEFAEESDCEIVVTGGTERGHAGGQYSHGNGYKIDIATGACVDRAVRRYPFAGVRGDGAKLYRSPAGALFARESDHWDILFR